MRFAVDRHQLPYYLDEFTFRFNRRRSTHRGTHFYSPLRQAVETDPQTLSKPLNPKSLHLGRYPEHILEYAKVPQASSCSEFPPIKVPSTH